MGRWFFGGRWLFDRFVLRRYLLWNVTGRCGDLDHAFAAGTI
jgi:hypothetical protein